MSLTRRFSLNIKGLPYKTEWLSFLEIPKVLEANGTPKTDEGYTLPAIVDPNTGKAIQDSIPIMEYLDAQVRVLVTPYLYIRSHIGRARSVPRHPATAFRRD